MNETKTVSPLLPMAAPNGRLSRRLLEAMGLWDQALATGAVFVNPYDAANIADSRRNLADSLSLGFTYTSHLAGRLESAWRHSCEGGPTVRQIGSRKDPRSDPREFPREAQAVQEVRR